MLINGDCMIEMRKMEDCSIDFIVTDPPYGIGFMNKKFDQFKDQPAFNAEIWRDALRICKPGSMLAAFGGDRTHHHLMIALEEAGWEIRTCCYWIFGSGFPKSNNFGKKLGVEWHGYGTALKPSAEIIILAMKPLEGTFSRNSEKWGIAGLNIDESRLESELQEGRLRHGGGKHSQHIKQINPDAINSLPSGRWPAQTLFDEESAKVLDEMTGLSKSSPCGFHDSLGRNKVKRKEIGKGYNDIGGASRFFYCAKVSSKEREGSNHPTMKPIALMKYILKLLAPPGNPIVLDPFAGSGSTLMAAKELGLRYIGIEIEKEYFDICQKRLKDPTPAQP